MAKWYYLIDGQEVGPLESAELKRFAESGGLSPNQKVRRADLSDWHEAKHVKGLFTASETQGNEPRIKNRGSSAQTDDFIPHVDFVPRHRRAARRERILVTSLGIVVASTFFFCVFNLTVENENSTLKSVMPNEAATVEPLTTNVLQQNVVPRADLAAEVTPDTPQYTIVKTEDLSIGAVRRVQVRVSIPQHYSRSDVDRVANALVADITATHPVNAISILFFGPGSSIADPFDAALVEWAPNGRWGDAHQVEAGEYSTFAYSVVYKEPVPQPDRGLEVSGTTGLLGVPLPKGSRLIDQRPGDPTVGHDPSERYAVPASAVQISAFFSKEMPAAGWAKDGSSTNTTLFYQKGNKMIGVIFNRAGGTFTLMGS